MNELTLTRGDDRSFRATVHDEDTGAALDLTGAQAITFSLKQRRSDTAYVLQKTLGAGVAVTSAATGEIMVNLYAADTTPLLGLYVWDLVLLDVAGKVSTVDQGTLRVEPDVSGVATTDNLVPTSAVRALVKTTMSDTQLGDVIAREEALLADEVGQLGGSRVQTVTVTQRTAGAPIRLRRPAATVAVTERNIAVTDVSLGPRGRTLYRLSAGGYSQVPWLGVVEVTYTPNDLARVTSWVIELVRARLAETGHESESDSTYSYTRGDHSHEQVLGDAVADILGMASREPRTRSRRIRSARMSTASSAPWLGGVRP